MFVNLKCLRSDIEVSEHGVLFDERTARWYFGSHQVLENFVRLEHVRDGDLFHVAHGRVERGFPELFGVHLAEALVALDADVGLIAQFLERGLQRGIVVQVFALASDR